MTMTMLGSTADWGAQIVQENASKRLKNRPFFQPLPFGFGDRDSHMKSRAQDTARVLPCATRGLMGQFL
jgi:hypothetical protein